MTSSLEEISHFPLLCFTSSPTFSHTFTEGSKLTLLNGFECSFMCTLFCLVHVYTSRVKKEITPALAGEV